MEIGTAAHCLVLDGENAFNGAYVRQPDNIKLTTKEGKEWKASVGRKKVLNYWWQGRPLEQRAGHGRVPEAP